MHEKGKKFGFLEVISDTGKEVLCYCHQCGSTKQIPRLRFRNRKNLSCGCGYRMNALKLAEKKDLTGRFFEGVEVIRKTDLKKGTQYVYECKCLRCGKIFCTRGVNLTRGDTKSCGCLKTQMNVDQITQDVINGTKISAIIPRIRSDNTSGKTGVSKTRDGWVAYISFQGMRYQLYRGHDKEIAIQKRKKAEENIHVAFLEWYSKEYPEVWKKIIKKSSD